MLLSRAQASLLAGVVVLGACVEHEERPAPQEARVDRRASAIQGGAADGTSAFAVMIFSEPDGVCSGTLIAPNLVLTARHCVSTDSGGDLVNCRRDRFDPPVAPSTLRISTDANAEFETAAFRATKIVVPSDTLFCGNDLALIVLDTLVPAAVATPATPAIDPPLTDRTTYGSTLTAIGYGATAPGANDEGSRRKRANISVTCIPGDTTLGCDLNEFDMTTEEFGAAGGLCEGDSGAGAFEPTSLATKTPIVIGVLSRALDIGARCADAVYARTDTAGALLKRTANEAATLGGYVAPAWANPNPKTEPLPDAGIEPPPEAPGADPLPSPAPSGNSASTEVSGCGVARSAIGWSSEAARARLPVHVFAIAVLAFARRRRRTVGIERVAGMRDALRVAWRATPQRWRTGGNRTH